LASEALTRIYVKGADTDRDRIQFVTLGGFRIGLRCRYAAVDARWRLWVLDIDGSQIFGPATMVPGIDLLVGAKHDPRVPSGELFVYSADREPPTADTMDVGAVLYYREA
jgi:hypothetical protein